eukprot:226512-Karenia_brevis.AAC.1
MDLREDFNWADVQKWKKIEDRYQKGTLHYAAPHLFHHGIIASAEVSRILHRHDTSAKDFGSDVRKVIIAQAKLLQQMVESGFNNTMGSVYQIRFYE